MRSVLGLRDPEAGGMPWLRGHLVYIVNFKLAWVTKQASISENKGRG